MGRYHIRSFYDWGCSSPFWSGNDAARAKFPQYCIDPKLLGLSEETYEKIYTLGTWDDTALNWNYPPDPSP